MTVGDSNYSVPLANRTAGSNWVGVRGWKVWNGTDKLGPAKSEVPSPQAPVFVSKLHKHRGAFQKRHSVADPATFHPDSRRGKRDAARAKTEPVPAPFGGRETVRWGSVIREDNAAPKRAHAEFHDYDMVYFMSRQEVGVLSIGAELDGNGDWIPSSGILSSNYTPEQVCGVPNFTHTWSTNDDLVMLERLRTRVAGSDFNAGVFLGESREALKMIAENATRIYRAYGHARKGNLYDAARALGVSPRVKKGSVTKRAHVAARWLELQYGWLPLLKDVYGGAEFLAHHLNVPLQRRYRIRRKAVGIAASASPVNWNYKSSWCVTQGQIIAIIKEKDVAQLSGLQDPASILWELTPFSFVADWFIPIGSWLASRGLASALEGVYITTKTRRDYAAEPVAEPKPYPYSVPGKYEYREVQVERRVTTTLTVPLPEFKPLSKVVSWKRAANAVALLVVLSSGLKLPPGVKTD